ncbi:MAG: hypothetical protein ACK5Y6_10075 [Pseudomonadota bacterium]|jgi:hypothetical protein
MAKTDAFSRLSAYDRARVALAVLLDGGDAPIYLMNDQLRGADLRVAAEELLEMELDVRYPYVGTMLRLALEEAK